MRARINIIIHKMKRRAAAPQGKFGDAGLGFNIWRTRPPCDAQLELNRLFELGEIDRSLTPDKVRQLYPIFHKYSSTVFASHFRTTKAEYGLNGKTSNTFVNFF